ncbi:TetR family transcriptional regulator [Sphaerisporangium melleum]|uniref:TetR family transcriptional regulator n=1 Tax=Sphaerisporangium melleum TaxID=321316 RepID=A0A917VUU6_9ACTN|nr:TetR/AcrR family transcriptional regulator [Sphaerisporangium melleum]GGL16760.1 TetR family transcriptional regulator [Sphaerisporangium melleum]GII74652.1 TetR family transcriptional regulator [Sphaerisporangium melleum]
MARIREFDTEAALAAAMSAFRRKGYEATSVQDLVDATGVGRGSLYAAFGNKEGLYLAVMDRYREQYAVPLVELLASGAPARDLIRAMLVGVVDEIVRDGEQLSCLIVSATTERLPHDPDVAKRVRATTASLEDALTEAIREAQERGQVTSAREARDLAAFLLATVHGVRVMGAINSDRGSLMRIVEVALGCLD